MITIEGAHAVARFRQFDLADYATFLKLKRTVPAPEMDLKYDWRSDSYTVKMPARYTTAVPEPEFIVHQVQATPEQMQEAQRYRFEIGAGLIGDQRLGVKERMKLSQIAKGFVYENQPLAIGS